MILITNLKHIPTKIYKHYEVLPFRIPVKYGVEILIFKIYFGHSPKFIADTFNTSNHLHKTRNRFHLKITVFS